MDRSKENKEINSDKMKRGFSARRGTAQRRELETDE